MLGSSSTKRVFTKEAPKQVVHVQNGQTTHYRITVDSGLNIGLVPG